MIYLYRYSVDASGQLISEIAIVEDAAKVARYEAQGYDRCTREALSVAWSLRDERTLHNMAAEAEQQGEAALVARAIGHTL